MQYAVVIAGGTGTRLWPLSRGTRPKQLLVVGGGKSLLRLAYERLVGLLPDERILVCAGATHREAIAEELPELPPENFLGEPVGRDTANAIGFVSAVLRERDPDATLAFVTSDHVIGPVPAFQDAIRTAYGIVDRTPESLVVFGIPPAGAHTGLGYVERGAKLASDPDVFEVAGFAEKPDLATAQRYVESGRYLWNAGMFVGRAATLLDGLRRHLPESYAGMQRIADAWATPKRCAVLEEVYAGLPKVQIDYAVIEPAARAHDGHLLVVPMTVDWLDVGTWPSLARTLDVDPASNAHAAVTAFVDSAGNIVVSDDPEHLVAAVGLHDTIIVHTRDVTLVCPKAEAERIKDLVAYVRDMHGDRYA